MTSAPVLFLRCAIIGTYLGLLSPWLVFLLTGWLGFAGLGIGFLFVGALLLPKAIDDWNT